MAEKVLPEPPLPKNVTNFVGFGSLSAFGVVEFFAIDMVRNLRGIRRRRI